MSPYGIFSIETKQYNGYITGSKYDKSWVRHVGKNKYYYTNPIRQNYGHCKAIAELLNIDESKIYNIVCIPSKAKQKISNVNELYNTLIKSNVKDRKIKKEHIENIKTNIEKKDNSKCPKCGGTLVERESKYGKFIGCANYPRCKYTQKK